MSELTLITLSVALTVMVCLPLILTSLKQRNKSNLLMEQLKSETQVSHLKSGDFDTWREAYCIGLDQKNGQLLFLNSLEKGNQVQKIDLRQVRLCRPIRNFREMKVGKEKRQIIQKVSLKLDHYDEQSKPVTIEIYDEERSDYMINEWDLAQAWSQKINNLKN